MADANGVEKIINDPRHSKKTVFRMREERNKIQSENDEIVNEVTRNAWLYLHDKTKDFTDARRYIVFARVTGFFIGNVYMPQVEKAISDVKHIIENEGKTE